MVPPRRLAPAVDVTPSPTGSNGNNFVYGGRGRDVMQADSGGPGRQTGDRLVAWYGQHNLFLTCQGAYGAGWILRQPSPGMPEALMQLAESDGAHRATVAGSSGWLRLALVTQQFANENRGAHHPDAPGNNAVC